MTEATPTVADGEPLRRPPARRTVAIFRQNLFRISEPFITDQAQGLVGYAPFYLGRLRFGAAPDGARSFALADRGRLRALPAIVRQMATRAAAPFEAGLRGTTLSLIHAHFGIDAVHALPLAEQLGVPLVTTFHGFDATLSTPALLSSPAWAAYPLHRRALARRGALFLCVSSFIRERVLAQGFPPERTVVHYTGVDCAAIRPRDPAEARPHLLHVGRLVEMKGTATAIGFGARIVFLGARPHPEVLALMRTAAVLVQPSVRTGTGRTEGLGMVLLEAAATGVPVIASTVGGMPEGVRDRDSGILVPPRDPGALAAAMSALLADDAVRGRMGRAGRRFVEARFDGDRLGRALERFYDEVVAGARGPAGRPARRSRR